MVQCPVCANSELELLTQSGDRYKCVCGAEFTKSGEVILAAT